MTTFTARAVELADALANVLPHADDSSGLPILSAVEVTVADDGLVTLAATDRYTLASAEVISDGDLVPGAYVIPRAGAADVLKMAKAAKLGWLTLTHSGVDVTVTAPGTAITFQTVEGDFPKWRALLPGGELVATDVLGLGCAHLAKFAKIQRDGRTLKNAALRLELRGATKVVDAHVEGLDGFRAIIMPVRLAERAA